MRKSGRAAGIGITDEGGISVADVTPIPSGRIKVANVTSEVELIVVPCPAKEEPIRKLLVLPDMEKETGVFKDTLTNVDNNDPPMLVLSMETGDIPKEDPARSKNTWNVDPQFAPGVSDDAVKSALTATMADAVEVGLAISKNTMSS